MVLLMVLSFFVFVLLALAVRRVLAFWMRGERPVRRAEEQARLLDASVLTPEEKQRLRDLVKEKWKSELTGQRADGVRQVQIDVAGGQPSYKTKEDDHG